MTEVIDAECLVKHKETQCLVFSEPLFLSFRGIFGELIFLVKKKWLPEDQQFIWFLFSIQVQLNESHRACSRDDSAFMKSFLYSCTKKCLESTWWSLGTFLYCFFK